MTIMGSLKANNLSKSQQNTQLRILLVVRSTEIEMDRFHALNFLISLPFFHLSFLIYEYVNKLTNPKHNYFL
jgi:hypothetical protein